MLVLRIVWPGVRLWFDRRCADTGAPILEWGLLDRHLRTTHPCLGRGLVADGYPT